MLAVEFQMNAPARLAGASGDQREAARVSGAPRAQTKFVVLVNAVIFNGKIGMCHGTDELDV